ncbi:hypothetical protein FM106_31620 [Brachybacterium faecium]|nr:hypothetical protein FM106_31620 [Brachybacterium faecium]
MPLCFHLLEKDIRKTYLLKIMNFYKFLISLKDYHINLVTASDCTFFKRFQVF